MITAPIPEDEAKRLALLRACNIIYTPAEEAFDDVARLAADLCGTEIALITLIDSDYQWFKARVGVEHVGTSRDLSFCSHCIHHHDPLVVEDTFRDPRFADNPLVLGDPNIRFYAGVPLIVDEGSAIGALSVADRAPRTLTPRQLDALQRLAKQISRELRLRRSLGRSVRPESEFPIGPGDVAGNRWTVSRLLGRGATGAVFEATDAAGDRVALKVLLPEWSANHVVVERFAREARVLMRLKTPNVARLIEVGNFDAEHGGLPFLALEYLEGTDLENVLATHGPVPPAHAFAWAAYACDGVGEAHELGVVHRDIKPSNVFLATPDGRDPVVKVLDFGLAAGDLAAGAGGASKLSTAGTIMGSPAYMAPEQMLEASDVDPRSDVWSMGALLYEAVSGALPFAGDTPLQVFANVMTKPPLPLRSRVPLPTQAEAVIQTCMRKQRGDRYASMAALASALRAAIV